MLKIILQYGGSMAILLGLLKYFEYRFFVRDLSLEFYGGIVAVLFTILGVWIGKQFFRKKSIESGPPFSADNSTIDQLGISKRELEVLQLIAQGMSNREIADRLFLSPHTIKSHSSNLFAKLNARRRTEAIKKAKEMMLLP